MAKRSKAKATRKTVRQGAKKTAAKAKSKATKKARTTTAPGSAATAMQREFQRAEKVLAANYHRILRRKGVTHCDVNFRVRGGKRTDEIVIRVHVEQKYRREELYPQSLFDEIDGIPVDVVESQNTYSETAALQSGARIAPAHNAQNAGTLGIVCFAKGSQTPRFLTNAHVVFGGKRKSQLPSRIPMLHRPKGGVTTRLGDGLKNKAFRNAVGDAALIHPDDNVLFLAGVPGFDTSGGISQLTSQDVRDQVTLHKVGAKTGPTEGILDAIRLTFSVPGFTYFGQIGILRADGKPFSTGGDSGAVVIKDNMVVGLLHGVTDNGRVAVACHMPRVAKRLDIEL